MHKLIREKPMDELVVRGRVQELRVLLQDIFEALNEVTDVSVFTMNDNLTSVIKECAIEVGGVQSLDRTLPNYLRRRKSLTLGKTNHDSLK